MYAVDSADTTVDWEAVDDELAIVPAAFADPRFDSLRHVLNILGAIDPEPDIEELREYYARVDKLVDYVAEKYSDGFRKSIKNYSSILQLFTNAREHAKGLHGSLEEANRRLGVHAQNLQSQREMDMKLGHVVKILTDMSSLVDVPQHISQLQERQDWPGAVAALLDGCSKLARENMQEVGALRGIREDLAIRKAALHKRLVLELESLVFHIPVTGGTAGGGQGGDRKQQDASPDKLSPGRGLPPTDKSHKGSSTPRPPRPGAARGQGDATAQQAGRAKGKAETQTADAAPSGELLDEQRAVDSMTAAQRSAAASRLATCLVQTCGHMEALATMRRHMPVHMKNVILTSMKAFEPPKGVTAAVAAAAAAAVEGAPGPAVSPVVGQSAQKLADHVFIHCLQVLTGLIEVFKLLAGAKAPNWSPGLALLLTLVPPAKAGGSPDSRSQAAGDPSASGSPQAVRRECEAAWACMQAECQALLVDLLAAPSLQARDGGKRSDPTRISGSGDPGILTFSFDVQVGGMDIGRLLERQRSVVAVDERSHTSLLQAALGNHQATPDLTPFIYRPLLQFTEAAGRLVTNLGGEGLLVKSRALLLAPLEQALAPLGQDLGLGGGGGKGGGNAQLRGALERFITDRYLPDVFINSRGQCTRLLEQADSFRAPARPRGTYSSSQPGGRPLMPVTQGIKAMVAELLSCAQMMPLFETNLIGMVENILARVLDAFSSRVNDTIGNAACRGFVDDPAMATLMAREAAAPQLGDPVAFFNGRNPDGVDTFVTGVIKAGFGGGGDDITTAALAKLKEAQKWLNSGQLLSAGTTSTSRLVTLASLADSLSFLADDIGMAITRGPRTSEADSAPRGNTKWRASDGDGLLRGLVHLVDQYKALAGQAVRALRLDMQLTLMYYLSLLPRGQWVPDLDTPADVEDSITALSRVLGQAEEDLGKCLPPAWRTYVFGGLAGAAACFCVWLLPEIRDMNRAGVGKMHRHLTLLRDALSRLGGQRPDEAASRAHERARVYYDLLKHTPEEMLASLEQSLRQAFTSAEMTVLLQVNVRDREVTSEHRMRLNRIIGSAPRSFHQQAQSVLETSLSLAKPKHR